MKKIEVIINMLLAIFLFVAGAIILFWSIKYNYTGIRFAFSILISFLFEFLAGIIIYETILHIKKQ